MQMKKKRLSTDFLSILNSALAILRLTVPLSGSIYLENTHHPLVCYTSPDSNESITETGILEDLTQC